MNSLTIELDEFPATLRPNELNDYAGLVLGHLLNDTPFVAGARGVVRDGLCSVTGVSPDLRCWELEVRDSVWSDGIPVTAADVCRGIRHVARSRTTFSWMAGAIADCSPLNDRIRILMRRPVGYVRELLTNPVFGPRRAARGADPPPRIEAPVTGPYRISGFYGERRGCELELVGTARRAVPRSPSAVRCVVTDPADQGIRLFTNGTLDLTCPTTFPHRSVAAFRARPELAEWDLTIAVELWVRPNHDILSRPGARRAISLALDRYRLAASVHDVMVPLWRYTEMWDGRVDAPGPDPAEARRQWKHAGGPCDLELRLDYPAYPPNGDIAAEIAAQLSQTLPVKVAPNAIDYREYLGRAPADVSPLQLGLTAAPWADPSSMLAPYQQDSFLGDRMEKSAGFAAAVEAGDSEVDGARRRASYEAAADRFLDVLPVIPVLRVRGLMLRTTRLTGPELASNGLLSLELVHPRPVNDHEAGVYTASTAR